MRNYEFGIRNYYKLPVLPNFTFHIYKLRKTGRETRPLQYLSVNIYCTALTGGYRIRPYGKHIHINN